MKEFNLSEIVADLEQKYEVEFEIIDNRAEAKTTTKDKHERVEIIISVGKYTCLDERQGKPFVGVDMWINRTYGFGHPCDSMDQVYGYFNKYIQKRLFVQERLL